MALSIITPIPYFTPVRNPAWFEVQCDGYLLTPAVAAEYTLGITAVPTAGTTFSILVGDVTTTFEWVSGAVDESGTQVQVGGSTGASMTNLMAALLANWTISHGFILSGSIPITLTVRDPAHTALFNDTDPPNMVWTETVPGNAAAYAENYNPFVQVWVEKVRDSGIYHPLPACLASVLDNRARWNLAGMLRPYVEHTWPVLASSDPFTCPALQCRYYVDRYEQSGSPPLPRRVYHGTQQWAWYAGSRNNERAIIDDVFQWVQNPYTLNPWLTYHGRGGRHEVSAQQPHYLSLCRPIGQISDELVELVATVYYSDGTSVGGVAMDDAGMDWLFEMVATWPTGFNALGLEAFDPTKTAVRYTVQLICDSMIVPWESEIHTFILMPEDANEQYLEYVNSFGVVESMRCDGQWTTGITPEYATVQRHLSVLNSVFPSPQISEHLNLLQGAQQRIRMSSGYMDRETLNAYVDVFLSPELRRLNPETGIREPVRLVAAEFATRMQGDPLAEHLYAINMELLLGDPEMAWSDRLSMPPLGE